MPRRKIPVGANRRSGPRLSFDAKLLDGPARRDTISFLTE
jgi:hypothetical protein